MIVEWNPLKAKRNNREHGVSFSEAELVLFDPLALTMEDFDAEGDTIRMISARKASSGEVKAYER